MKLATLEGATLDGTLVLVSTDLSRCIAVPDIAPNLQRALDIWTEVAPALQARSDALNEGRLVDGVRPFRPEEAKAPLPRCYQMFDAGNYLRHFELMAKMFPRPVVGSTFTEPTGYQSGRSRILGPCEPVHMPARSEILGMDFEAELAVITDRVPMCATSAQAAGNIRLIVLMNDFSLRNLGLRELEKGFGLFLSKPICALAPVAVTPDEFGSRWDGDKLHLPVHSTYNGKAFGKPNAGEGMLFGFPDLIAYCAQTRELGAGTMIGGGTVSNLASEAGSGCIAERRALEMASHGEPETPFMRFGDRIRIEVLDDEGKTIFGAIDQVVQRLSEVRLAS